MRLLPAAVVAAFLVVAAPSAGARERPLFSLSVSPARIALGPGTTAEVDLTNFGSHGVALRASATGLAVDLRGRPRIARRSVRRSAAAWLHLRPRDLRLGPRGRGIVAVAANVPAGAEPGDHHALVLFSTRPELTRTVAVRMRVGVRVRVRVPGTIVHRVVVRNVRVRRVGQARVLDVGLANRGNVTEAIGPNRLVVSLLVRGRVHERVRTGRRELLPGASAVLSGTYRGGRRGWTVVRVVVGRGAAREFRVRL